MTQGEWIGFAIIVVIFGPIALPLLLGFIGWYARVWWEAVKDSWARLLSGEGWE